MNFRIKSIIPQLLTLLFVVAVIGFFTINAQLNMEERGIDFGYGFLNQESSFDVQFSLIEYDGSHSYFRAYLVGLLNTILVSVIGIIIATIIGVVVGVARLSPNYLINKFAAYYVEFFRNIPLLLQIFFWYFAALRALPLPQDAEAIFGVFFLTIKGLYVPAFIWENFNIFFYSIVAAIIAIIVIRFQAKKLQETQGKQIPVFLISIGLILMCRFPFSSAKFSILLLLTCCASVLGNSVHHSSHMSPHARPIVLGGDYVYVANTPSDTVDVIHAKTREVVKRIPVGIDPVGLAIRPDGKELWVTNHISDSVSVIDTDAKKTTFHHVVGTVQDFDQTTKATRFDEPVGIAFANNSKAYVSLSSENQIAVINVATRKVIKRLTINAQDPRAIVVRDGHLYVAPFESNNQTQLSGGTPPLDGKLKTFDAWEHSIRHNNVLSIGHVVDIVRHPDVPDRDLYVFDTENEELVEVVSNLGTLLYGLTVDSKGRVYIAQADARNDVNGKSGTEKHGLKQLENRAFLNQVTRVEFGDHGTVSQRLELEPLLPEQPTVQTALATPFAIQISDDDATIVATAASSDKVFTMDAKSGEVLGRVKVGAVPRGIALNSAGDGKAKSAWVLNAVENTVSVIDLRDVAKPVMLETVILDDPTDPVVKKGRMMFNTAAASTTGTFSCASCHPDGHTDQLLWVLNTPIVTGGNQIMPRSTMPIRGLRDTEPYHWDGIPGDPYGGNNSFSIHKSVEPNSDIKNPVTSTRHLIDGGLANTMMLVGYEGKNDKGQACLLYTSDAADE